jgi:predicted transcriptional regulator
MLPRPKPSDPLVIAAANLVAGWLHHGTMPLEAIAGEVLRQYERLQDINQHRKAAWQDEAPLGPDVLDAAPVEPQAVAEAVPPRVKAYPPPVHPLAQRGVTQAEKIEGTVTPAAITCLECGKPVTLLKTHLRAKHDGMTWGEYLDRHGLPATYPPVAQDHKDRQSAQMKEYRTNGTRIPADQLVRAPKKKADVKGKGTTVSPDFSRNRRVADDGEDLFGTG